MKKQYKGHPSALSVSSIELWGENKDEAIYKTV